MIEVLVCAAMGLLGVYQLKIVGQVTEVQLVQLVQLVQRFYVKFFIFLELMFSVSGGLLL